MYDVTSCLATWSHVSSREVSVSGPMLLLGVLCLWPHVTSRGSLSKGISLDRDPLPGQGLPPWTETPLPGQGPPPWIETPLPGQRPSPWIETPLSGQRPSFLDRDLPPWIETPPLPEPPWTETPQTETPTLVW